VFSLSVNVFYRSRFIFLFLRTRKSSGTKRFRDTQYFTGASQDTCITTIGPDDIIIPAHFCPVSVPPAQYYFYRYYFLILSRTYESRRARNTGRHHIHMPTRDRYLPKDYKNARFSPIQWWDTHTHTHIIFFIYCYLYYIVYHNNSRMVYL